MPYLTKTKFNPQDLDLDALHAQAAIMTQEGKTTNGALEDADGSWVREWVDLPAAEEWRDFVQGLPLPPISCIIVTE